MRLPDPKTRGTLSVEEAISKRRSRRRFLAKDLSESQIAQLVWAAQGRNEQGLRNAPSAGATYPLELYLVNREGVYHYVSSLHQLGVVKSGNVMAQLRRACLDQTCVEDAPASFVIAASYQRTALTYGSRAERYVHMEAGHAAQNMHLQAVSMRLGSVPIGAFRDRDVKEILGLPEDEEPLYVIPVGYSAE